MSEMSRAEMIQYLLERSRFTQRLELALLTSEERSRLVARSQSERIKEAESWLTRLHEMSDDELRELCEQEKRDAEGWLAHSEYASRALDEGHAVPDFK